MLHADTQELHARFHYSLRSITITRHNAVRKTTVINTYPDSRMVLATYIKEWNQTVLDTLKLCLILFISIFQMLELTGCINIVARIDTNFLAIEGSHLGYARIEVDVGNQRNVATSLAYTTTNFFQILSLTHTLCGQADKFATCFSKNLAYAPFGIHRRSSAHRLHTNRIISSNSYVSYTNFVGFSSYH